MRIHPGPKDDKRQGDERTRTFFVWWPLLMPDDSTVWLERVTVREVLYEWTYLNGLHARWEWRIVEEVKR